MKAKIQAYWGAEVKTTPAPTDKNVDSNFLVAHPIRICDISIDGKLKGSILWNGKELTVQPP